MTTPNTFADDASPRLLSGLRSLLPTGSGLTEEVWRGRHRAIVLLAWAHAVGVPIYGRIQGRTWTHALLEGAPIATFSLLASLPLSGRRFRSAAASAALLTSSAILVHFSDGLIEMHFHFFVMVPIVALYQDWVPFLLSFGYVLVHHGLIGQLSPESVFNHPWGREDPWQWAAVHALFIAGTSIVCLATWRMNDRTLLRQHEAEERLRDEKRVVETLHSIGTGVVAELDIDRVAQLVTDEAVEAVGAQFGAFFYNVIDKSGERYLLYTLSGAPREAFESFPMPRNTKVFEPTFTGRAVVRSDDITQDPRYGQSAPYHGMPQGHLSVRSYLAVPVRSRGSSEVLGGLFFAHEQPGVFGEAEERIVVGIATQAAIAFDNARLYQGERDARASAEGARARLTMLADVGRLLVAFLDPDTTLRNLAQITVPTLADVCVVDLLDSDGNIRRVTVYAGPGFEETGRSIAARAPDAADVQHPVVRVINGGRPEMLAEDDDDLVVLATPGDGYGDGTRQMRGSASIVVPLVGRDEVLGAVSFLLLHASGRSFEADDVPLAEVLGRRAGMALENARLYQAEIEARAAADRATRRLGLLAEAGRSMTSTLEEDVALGHLAQVTVPTLADACLIDTLAPDGTISRKAAAAPGLEHIAQALVPFPPGYDDEAHPIIRVMHTGEPVLVERIDDAFLDSITRLPAHRRIAQELHPRSGIIVPLAGRQRAYGTIALINVEMSGRLFGPDDLALAEEIGRRAGMALENAKLYSEQRTVAESLQHALLPEQLPDITGFETTARYLPGSPGERVGGDWYDLFELPSGDIAIVMGDVVGHGIAAASLMAQLRNGLRAYVWDGLSPADVLAHLNQLLYGLEPDGMATATVGLLDPITTKLTIANAGHLPPLRVRGSDAEFFGEGLGPPLGAVPFASFREIEIDLAPGDTAVFYTDGLVEDRTHPLDEGLDRMRSAVVGSSGTIDELCETVLERCIGGRPVEDDVAVLVLRSLRLGNELSLELPNQPRVLGSLRQTLRRWMHEHALDDEDSRDVLVACGEACNNAIEHGSALPRGTFEIDLSMGEDLTVVVRNDGGWREPRDDGGGRGLALMRALMDDVQIVRDDHRTEIRMRRRVTRAEPAA